MQHKIYWSNKNVGKTKCIIFSMFHYEQGRKVIDFMILSKKRYVSLDTYLNSFSLVVL